MSTKNDILQSCAHGDRQAFALLYDHYAPKCAGFVHSFLKDSEEAADITQDIFIKLWVRRSRLARIKNFEAYLAHIAKNAVLDKCDHIQVTRKFAENFRVEFKEGSDETSDRFEAKELQRQIQKAVATMPPMRRKVFILSRFNGLDNGSIASLCGISGRTVQAHLFQATRALKQKLRSTL